MKSKLGKLQKSEIGYIATHLLIVIHSNDN